MPIISKPIQGNSSNAKYFHFIKKIIVIYIIKMLLTDLCAIKADRGVYPFNANDVKFLPPLLPLLSPPFYLYLLSFPLPGSGVEPSSGGSPEMSLPGKNLEI
jgi:hypothetical protein